MMTSGYIVGPIASGQVDRAYRLVEAVGCDIGLARWRKYCSNAVNRHPAEDIVTVETPHGYVAGLAVVRVRHSRRFGRVLDVPVFIVISTANAAGTRNALLGYAMAMARGRHCRLVRIAGSVPAGWPGAPQGGEQALLIPVG